MDQPAPEQAAGSIEKSLEDTNLVLKHLRVRNFRNYESATLDDLGMLNVFIGPNASGKTSLVEAIQLVTACKSFRTSHYHDVVKWGATNSMVACTIEGNGRMLSEELSIREGKRVYALNGNTRSIETIKGILPAVVFCPDDLELVKGSNTPRRNAIDDMAAQVSQSFRGVKRDYTRLVRQKNQALKDEADQALIDSINSVLVKVSAQYTAHRQLMASKLAVSLRQRYHALTDGQEEAGIAYRYSWDALKESTEDSTGAQTLDNRMLSREEIMEETARALELFKEEERTRKKALVGAHADKISFLLNHRNATKFASQGQQRSIVLSLKLAELDILSEVGAQVPILLLDDVMSELDHSRRQQFMSLVDKRVQTFITTTNKEYFDEELLARAQVYAMPLDAQQPGASSPAVPSSPEGANK